MSDKDFKDLLNAPKKFKEGKSYTATNVVFLVNYEGDSYVVKKPRSIPIADAVYTLEDKLFFGTRKLSTTESRFRREVEMLQKMDGKNMPKLIAYDDSNWVLVREHLSENFRGLEDGKRESVLEQGLEALSEIYGTYGPLGDAHVKNLLVRGNGDVCWTGISGIFEDEHIWKSDLLKFIYSTWCVTKDEELTKYSAELVAQKEKGLAVHLPERSSFFQRVAWWGSNRIPLLDDSLYHEVRQILK